MAAYPDTPTSRPESKRTPVSTRIVDRNDVGAPWVRDPGTVQYWEFEAFHPFITEAQKDAVIAHWEAHKTAVFDYLWPLDGNTYQVIYAVGRPEDNPITAMRWHVRTRLLSVS
jgi:hypothetical protein